MRKTLNCHECGKEYYADELIAIDCDKDIYSCSCGCDNVYI